MGESCSSKKTIQPAYLLWTETKATVIASVLEGGLVQRKTGNLRNVSLSAPRIPGGTPPSRLLPSVIFCHAASCALNRGATPSLHTARWTRRRTGYRHLSRDMVEVVTIFSWLPKFGRNRQISATRTADLPYTRIAEEGSNPVTGRLSLSHGLTRLDSLGVLPPATGELFSLGYSCCRQTRISTPSVHPDYPCCPAIRFSILLSL